MALSPGGVASATITRPNDTAAYTANDVIGAATGSTAAVSFTLGTADSVPRSVKLVNCSLEIDAAAVIASETSYRLYLYSVTPPSALGDNAAWDLPSGDRASFLGYVDLGTPVDLGSTLFVQTTSVDKRIKLASGSTTVYGYLVTNAGYTPTASRVYIINLAFENM